jgi:hypothetical protein
MTEALPLVLKMAMAIAPQDWEPIPEIWSAEGKQTRIGRRAASIRRVLTLLEMLGEPTPIVAEATHLAINANVSLRYEDDTLEGANIDIAAVPMVLRSTAKAAIAEYNAYAKEKENNHV